MFRENVLIKKQATEDMTTIEKVKFPEYPISDVHIYIIGHYNPSVRITT